MTARDAFTYEPIDYNRHYFRLLKLHRSSGGEIEAQICHAALDTQPYEALSYGWGSLELVEAIKVDGKTLRVTHSLHAALHHLRLPDQDRKFWIDAVCINQRDNVERGGQMRRMRSIYQQARRVVVWLGKATAETQYLFEWLSQAEMHPTFRHSSSRED